MRNKMFIVLAPLQMKRKISKHEAKVLETLRTMYITGLQLNRIMLRNEMLPVSNTCFRLPLWTSGWRSRKKVESGYVGEAGKK